MYFAISKPQDPAAISPTIWLLMGAIVNVGGNTVKEETVGFNIRKDATSYKTVTSCEFDSPQMPCAAEF